MLPTRQPVFARCGVRGRAATRRRGNAADRQPALCKRGYKTP